MKKTVTLLAAICTTISSASAQTTYTHVECGTEFTIAVRSDSTLWAWGFNANGQLGTTAVPSSDTPKQVLSTHKWIFAATGATHTMGIAADSTLWGWGNNGNGQLGIGTYNFITAATQVSATQHWRFVSAGEAHTMPILNDGSLWGAGFNYYAQLGTGDTVQHNSFVRIGTDNDWKTVAAGGVFTLAIKNDGSLWGWGYNGDGELGTGTTDTVLAPRRIGTANDWAMVSGGFEFSLAMKSDGTIWSTGFNGNGQLGIPATGFNDSVFTQIGSATDWKSIAAGSSFGLGIKTNGTLWGWGYNAEGQLGTTSSSSVAVSQIGTETDWQYISAADGLGTTSGVFGLHSAGFKTAAYGICTAGADYEGQLGNGTTIAAPGGQDFFDCSVAAVAPAGIATVAGTSHDITLYPNPASTEITIDAAQPITDVAISNTLGQTVLNQQYSSKTVSINIATLPVGVYFVKINGADTRRFVKE